MNSERLLTVEIGSHVGPPVRLMGWVHPLPKMGEVNFLVVRDRSGLAQAVLAPADLAPLEGLQSETVIAVEGDVIASEQAPGGFELYHATVEVISPVRDDIPFSLNKNRIKATLPVFLDHAVIGHRALDRRAVMKIVAGVMAGFRAALQAPYFTPIHTPKLIR